jgi:hypothetical protein
MTMMRFPLVEDRRAFSVDWWVDFVLIDFLLREGVELFADSEIMLCDSVVVVSGVAVSLRAG